MAFAADARAFEAEHIQQRQQHQQSQQGGGGRGSGSMASKWFSAAGNR
jgi:hypothetical protein